MMEYKGYVARVEFDDENDTLYGEIVGTQDVITFEAASVGDLRREFKKSVDEYLKFCEEQGKEPDKSFPGQFLTRADPDLHRKVSILASLSGLSLNTWVVENLRRVVDQVWPTVDDTGTPSAERIPSRGRAKHRKAVPRS
jgi:predicted HicB family RNase H-like nuclease